MVLGHGAAAGVLELSLAEVTKYTTLLEDELTEKLIEDHDDVHKAFVADVTKIPQHMEAQNEKERKKKETVAEIFQQQAEFARQLKDHQKAQAKDEKPDRVISMEMS